MRSKKCKECGKSFAPKRSWQKFCDKDCRMFNYWKKKSKEKKQ